MTVLVTFQDSSKEERVKAMSTATAAANGWAKSTKVTFCNLKSYSTFKLIRLFVSSKELRQPCLSSSSVTGMKQTTPVLGLGEAMLQDPLQSGILRICMQTTGRGLLSQQERLLGNDQHFRLTTNLHIQIHAR